MILLILIKKFSKITLFLCFLPLFLNAKEYHLVIGSMFKNEAPRLKEWIAYHELLGVEHFYLYNNDSNDEYQEVLAPYIESGLVELIDWPSIQDHFHEPESNALKWTGFQLAAFNDCISKTKGKTDWIALIDIDEFLLPLKGPEKGIGELNNLLGNASPEIGSFHFFWRNFGTSFIQELSHTDLIIEKFVKRANDEDPNNMHYKSFHRPEAVMYTYAHAASLREGFIDSFVDPNNIRINHYYLGDQKTCLDKRCSGSFDILVDLEQRYGIVDDNLIFEFIPFVKKKLSGLH